MEFQNSDRFGGLFLPFNRDPIETIIACLDHHSTRFFSMQVFANLYRTYHFQLIHYISQNLLKNHKGGKPDGRKHNRPQRTFKVGNYNRNCAIWYV